MADSNTIELSVSELSGAIKRTVEDAFGYVRLRGEISGFRGPHSSGHCYFALKDEKAKIDAIIWRGVYNRLSIKPDEGLEVIATGNVTTYPGRSSYQIVIDKLEPAGEGALLALLKERERKLSAEGLFDKSAKRPLPTLPRTIGVVTSPTGAVIRDILHRLADRFPTHVVVWPVRVQGEGSGDEVAQAITGFNAIAPGGVIPRPDLLIVARGGGSLEDLWGFNDEAVVRAVAASDIPLISAVGHETDVTLIDHAADVRAPTPTAAAELAVPVRRELMVRVDELAARRGRAISRLLGEAQARLDAAGGGLPRRAELFALPRQRLDAATSDLAKNITARLTTVKGRFAVPAARLSPVHLRGQMRIRRLRVGEVGTRIKAASKAQLGGKRSMFGVIAARLSPNALNRRTINETRHVKDVGQRLKRAFSGKVEASKSRLQNSAALLGSLGHGAVLSRGYALVQDSGGKVLRSSVAAKKAGEVTITLAEGKVGALVNKALDEGPTPLKKPKAPPRKKATGANPNDQGSLF